MDITKLKVLVVEDYSAVRKLMELILLEIGVTAVDQAADTEEAAQKLNATAYDIILLDWSLPGSSGYHFLQTCRAERKYDKVAFIIVSAESSPRLINEAMKAGATSYIIKPFTDKIMREHLNKTLVWLDEHNGKPGDSKSAAGTAKQKS